MPVPAFMREPLVQFLAIGAVLAGLHALAPSAPGAPAQVDTLETITVTEGRIEQLEQLFHRTWQRPPTQQELDGLVDAFVREEVLYRAGRALGLGEDDTVVRRRIAQKMEFLMEPAPGELAPTDEALERHLAAFPERFERPARVGFAQVYLDAARRGASLPADVAAVRSALGEGTDPAELGDRTLLPTAVGTEPLPNVARTFGEAFANVLLEAPQGEWTGPVVSSFGVHLVRVDEREPARVPALAEVREAVLADWQTLRSREVGEERFEEMKARFRIVVEGDDGISPASPTVSGREEAAALPARAVPVTR